MSRAEGVEVDLEGNVYVSGTSSGPYGAWTVCTTIQYNNGTGIGDNAASYIPTTFSLDQNYPNPFNSFTIIRFSSPKSGLITLKIFDLLGREIDTLLNEKRAAGEYSACFL